MESLVLEVEKRQAGGKGPARRTRAQGKVPGVFYGPGTAATPVAMDAIAFDRQVRGLEGTHLIQLKSPETALNGKMVLVRDLQEHPVSGRAVHVDLIEVPLDKAIEVSVPLHFVGKPEGVTLGGVLQPIVRELQVNCLPTHIPQSIDVDVTHLGIHDVLHANEVILPEGATRTTDDNAPIVSVQPPTVAEAAAEEEAVEGVEGVPPAEGAPGEAAPAEPAAEDEDKS